MNGRRRDTWQQLKQQAATAQCLAVNQTLVVRPEEVHLAEARSVAALGKVLEVEGQQLREAVAELATVRMVMEHMKHHRG